MDTDGWVSDDQIERLVGVRNWVDHAVVGKARPHETVRASTTGRILHLQAAESVCSSFNRVDCCWAVSRELSLRD
jgi:hypothetical protein